MLKVDKLDVFYGDLQALWEVSLQVDKGEIVAVVGSNGSGKSTLLKTISGIMRPRSGSVYFDDVQVNNKPTHEIIDMGIFQVPEGRNIFPELSVADNLRLGAYSRRKDRAWIKDRLEYICQLFPILRERRSQRAETMSGGERQMLSVGMALMAKPQLLMLDEPSIGLAPKLVQQSFDTIKKVGEEGMGILLVEQNVYQTLQISNRAYILELGRIVMEGKSKEMIEDPHVRTAYLGI